MDNVSNNFGDTPPKIEISKKIRYQKDKFTQMIKDYNSKERKWHLSQTIFPAHLDAITSIKTCGNLVITGSFNGEISIWKIKDLSEKEILFNCNNISYKSAILSLDVFDDAVIGGLGDGSIFVASCDNMRDKINWQKVGIINVDEDPLSSTRLLNTSKCVSCGLSGKVIYTDITREKKLGMISTDHPLKCLDKFSEGIPGYEKSVIYSNVAGTISLWDTRTKVEDIVVMLKPHVNVCAMKTLENSKVEFSKQPVVYLSTNDNYIKCLDLRKPSQPLYKVLTSTKVTCLDIYTVDAASQGKKKENSLISASQTNAKTKLFTLDCEQAGTCESDAQRGALLSCSFINSNHLVVGGVDRALYIYNRGKGDRNEGKK